MTNIEALGFVIFIE